MLTIKQMLTPYNFSDRPAGKRKIEYIVIHYFGSLGSAKAVANYFASAYRGASAHYSLDEGDIVWQSVLEEDVAWHCGTSGTYYHPDCRNSNSIGIEVRPYKIDPSTASSAAVQDWYFTEKTVDNLVEFTKALMRKYNIPPERVVRHYDVTHKWCPRPWMGDDINEYYGTTGNEQWEKFKERIAKEDNDDMTKERFKELYDEMRRDLQDNDCGKYSEEARAWAIETGLVLGGGELENGEPNYMWQDGMTREQFVTVLFRFAQKMGMV